MDSCICNSASDSSKSDNTELLALDFITSIKLLLLLCCLSNVLIILIFNYPVCTGNDITRTKKKSCNNKLLNSVSICTRSIEYTNSLLSAAFYRDIVNACACTCYSLKSCAP